MKRTAAVCFVLILAILFAPLCHADEGNYDTLAEWGIWIAVPEGTTAALEGNAYYIYAQRTGSIPYVMIVAYHYESIGKIVEDFTPMMKQQYGDLKITGEARERFIGNKDCWEIDYSYTVSGYEVRDRRIFTQCGEWIYMFASKEVEERNMVIGDMLDEVVEGCEFLEEDDELAALGEEMLLAEGYLYCQDDGMPKYWLDFTGILAADPVLHCFFRSGEPVFYEKEYVLDLSTAEIEGNVVAFRDVYDLSGADVSAWFRRLSIRMDNGEITMVVRRDNSTLAGGGDDNILTGAYTMYPVGIGGLFEYYDENDIRKYWLDLNREEPELHAMFRSGDPEYYEEVFILDASSAEQESEYSIRINRIYDSTGRNVSRWFRSFTLTLVQGAFLMNVERNEKTLAGGAEDNILTGVYLLEPHVYLRPAELGPFEESELARWAQIYYFRNTGFFPPECDVTENEDGSLTIHLYEVVEQNGESHTATSAWYTVDEYGMGQDDITGREIDLCW